MYLFERGRFVFSEKILHHLNGLRFGVSFLLVHDGDFHTGIEVLAKGIGVATTDGFRDGVKVQFLRIDKGNGRSKKKDEQ